MPGKRTTIFKCTLGEKGCAGSTADGFFLALLCNELPSCFAVTKAGVAVTLMQVRDRALFPPPHSLSVLPSPLLLPCSSAKAVKEGSERKEGSRTRDTGANLLAGKVKRHKEPCCRD